MKTYLLLVLVGVTMLLTGCSSGGTDAPGTNEVHGPPGGAQPGAKTH